MAMVQTKQQTITDKDIRNKNVVSEKNRHLVHSVNTHPQAASRNQSIPLSEDKQKLLHNIENAYNDNLISEGVYRKTKEKLKSNAGKPQTTSSTENTKHVLHDRQKPPHHETSKPHPSPVPENKAATAGKDDSPQTEHKQKSTTDALKLSVISKSLYGQIKSKLESKPQLEEPQKAKTEPLSAEQAQGPDAEPKEEQRTDHEDKKNLKHHLEKIETDLHTMNRTLEPNPLFKDLHEQIRESEASQADTEAIEESANSSKAVKELRKKEESFSGDIKALDKIYKDDIISLESYEENKKRIEKKIVEIEDIILRTLEKEELDHLKDKLEDEIRASLTTGSFSAEHRKYREDIDALTRMHDLGMMSEEDYLKKKEELNARLNKTDTVISKIDAVFEEYKKELIAKIAEDESKIREQIKFSKKDSSPHHLQLGEELTSPPSPQEKPQGIIRKIKQFLGITYKTKTDDFTSDPIINEMKIIRRTQPPRDALIKCTFILKGLVEKEIDIKEEQTYNELIVKLATSSIEPGTRASLIQLFEKVSTGEYKDSMKKDETPKLLDEAERLAKLVGRAEEKQEEKKQIGNRISKKESGLLGKIDKLFGV